LRNSFFGAGDFRASRGFVVRGVDQNRNRFVGRRALHLRRGDVPSAVMAGHRLSGKRDEGKKSELSAQARVEAIDSPSNRTSMPPRITVA
jgi:hypothetical protein